MSPTWQSDDGRVQLYNADCLDVLPHLGEVDAVVTDPPYAIANRFGEQRTTHNGGRRSLEWAWDGPKCRGMVVTAVEAALKRTTTRASACVFCGGDTLTPISDVMREYKFTPKLMAWVKKCPPPPAPGTWWPSGFEVGLYAYRSGAWFGDTDPSRRNVFVADSYRHGQPGKVAHPTQKPLAIMRHIVRSIVPRGAWCMDPFMGSGTTGVAAVNLGRRFIGIEIDPDYFEVAKNRIVAAMGQTVPLKDSDAPLFANGE